MMKYRGILDVVLTGMLTLFIGLYFDLSGQLKIISVTNIEVKERLNYMAKNMDRQEIDIEKMKIELATNERSFTKGIHKLRVEYLEWFKRTNRRIDLQ